MDTTTLLSSAKGSPNSKADLKLTSLLISSSSHPPSPECLPAQFFSGSDDRIPRPVLGPRASQEVEAGCRGRRWALFFGDRLIQKGLQTCLGLPLSMYLGKSLLYLVVCVWEGTRMDTVGWRELDSQTHLVHRVP